jgi:hypothetical protein
VCTKTSSSPCTSPHVLVSSLRAREGQASHPEGGVLKLRWRSKNAQQLTGWAQSNGGREKGRSVRPGADGDSGFEGVGVPTPSMCGANTHSSQGVRCSEVISLWLDCARPPAGLARRMRSCGHADGHANLRRRLDARWLRGKDARQDAWQLVDVLDHNVRAGDVALTPHLRARKGREIGAWGGEMCREGVRTKEQALALRGKLCAALALLTSTVKMPMAWAAAQLRGESSMNTTLRASAPSCCTTAANAAGFGLQSTEVGAPAGRCSWWSCCRFSKHQMV